MFGISSEVKGSASLLLYNTGLYKEVELKFYKQDGKIKLQLNKKNKLNRNGAGQNKKNTTVKIALKIAPFNKKAVQHALLRPNVLT